MGGIPLRMNEVQVSFKRIDVAATKSDPDFIAPKSGTAKRYTAVVQTLAQIVWDSKDKADRAVTGDPGTNAGHLCFSRKRWDKETVGMKKGDIITEVAGIACNCEVEEVRPSGHLRRQSNLVMVYFGNNQETNPVLRR